MGNIKKYPNSQATPRGLRSLDRPSLSLPHPPSAPTNNILVTYGALQVLYCVVLYLLLTIFTALHGMQRGLNDEISVRLSVRLSVCLSNACIVTKRKKDMF